MSNKYGPEHRAAREEKLASMKEKKCEVTGTTKNLQAHHNVPRLFNGPDTSANYIMLTENFHQQILHRLCNAQDEELVRERVKLSTEFKKSARDDFKAKKIKGEIDKLDDVLIHEYIHNMLNRLPHDVRERVIELTLIHSFKTIRDQAMELLQIKSKSDSI